MLRVSLEAGTNKKKKVKSQKSIIYNSLSLFLTCLRQSNFSWSLTGTSCNGLFAGFPSMI